MLIKSLYLLETVSEIGSEIAMVFLEGGMLWFSRYVTGFASGWGLIKIKITFKMCICF